MNNQSPSRKRVWLISLGAIIIFVFLIMVVQWQQHKNPSYTTKLVDRDTGEVAYTQPNKEVEQSAGGGSVIIFGSSAVFDNGTTQEQYSQIKKILADYSSENLEGKYQSVTLIPKSFIGSGGDMKGQMRLGQGSTKVSVHIKLTNLYYVQVLITDPSGHIANFDSGVQPQNIPG